jgi:hypothetical protein
MTMNSPESMLALYKLATTSPQNTFENKDVYAAELMREVGLKCIGFNGVSRPYLLTISTINSSYGTRFHEQSMSLEPSSADFPQMYKQP